MSQQLSSGQTNSDSTSLGNLQSVGPNNQNPLIVTTLQNSSTVPAMQGQTQSQQSQYSTQSLKNTQNQSSTSNVSNEFPQVILESSLLDFLHLLMYYILCILYIRSEINYSILFSNI